MNVLRITSASWVKAPLQLGRLSNMLMLLNRGLGQQEPQSLGKCIVMFFSLA